MSTVAEPVVKSKKEKLDNDAIIALLFKQVPAVSNILKNVVINVYDNRYRINIYQRKEHQFLPNCGFIAASYFVKVEDGVLEILGQFFSQDKK